MKKWLTILLLFVLVAQSSGYFHAKTHDVCCVQENDEKGEKGGEEKHDKEYLAHNFSSNPLPTGKIFFSFFSCEPPLPPVFDHLTPPPDVSV